MTSTIPNIEFYSRLHVLTTQVQTLTKRNRNFDDNRHSINTQLPKERSKPTQTEHRHENIPVKKLADLGVLGANDLALNPQSEPVRALQPQEIRSPQRDLPQHHLSLSLSLSL